MVLVWAVYSKDFEIGFLHTCWVSFGCHFSIQEPRGVKKACHWLSYEIKASFDWPSHKASYPLEYSERKASESVSFSTKVRIIEYATYTSNNSEQ